MPDIAGQQLGNYRLLRQIGHGGFAYIYLGEHIYLNTQAAIKVLKIQLGDDESEQFLHEARTVAHLMHPHIIRVLDFGLQEYTPFLVMDYAPNGTLRDRHPSGTRLPLGTIVSYVNQIASALQYAHDQHFIHRDVKPNNMLIGRQNEILLSDFGTALIAHSTQSQSTEDQQTVVGTIAYMAPEQINGKPRPASDQYALGIVVYEWLAGQLPFRGSLPEMIAQQMSAPPPPLHERFPDISPEVEEAVNIALAKDPTQRFDTVTAFAHALEEAYQSEQKGNGKAAFTVPIQKPDVRKPNPLPPTQPALVLTPPQSNGMRSLQQQVQQERTEPQPRRSIPTTSQKRQTDIPQTEIPQAPRRRHARVSHLGQFVATILGLVLYGGAYYFITTLFQHDRSFASYALFSLALVIPLFCGVAFGPFAGLVIALGGFLIGHWLSGLGIYWNNVFGIGLTGFIAGLPMLRTRGHYGSFRSILLAITFACLGIVIGEAVTDCSNTWINNVGTTNAVLDFLTFSVAEVICALILLPVLLMLYNFFTSRNKSAV